MIGFFSVISGRLTVCFGRTAAGMTLVSLLCLLSSCGGTSGPGTRDGSGSSAIDLWPAPEGGAMTPAREGCGVLAGPSAPGGHFVFALTDPVLPSHAPIPRNNSERVVFAQLYETLVQVDCAGEMQPGLAESWTSDEDGAVWIFTIREGARFWDGSRITPGEVRRALSDLLVQTVNVLDDRRVAVRLTEPHDRFPRLLAQPAMAVSVTRPGWTWPVGSGPCRLRASDPTPLPDLTCRPNRNHPAAPIWKSLTFRVMPDTDPRDLVATDMDLTLVRDMDEVGFFNDAPGFHSVPVPWNRLYLLVCPPEMNPLGADRWIQAAAKLDVGRDVTAISARPWSEIAFPAGGDDRCPPVKGPASRVESARLDWNLAAKNLDQDVLVYSGDDPGAREIAHRLGALAGQNARTAALPDDSIDFVLRWEMAGAYVLSLDQQYPTGCLQTATLLGKATWLPEAVRNFIRPLGLGRSWLVVRGSLAGIELAFDGTPLLAGLGTAAESRSEADSGEATP